MTRDQTALGFKYLSRMEFEGESSDRRTYCLEPFRWARHRDVDYRSVAGDTC